METKDNNGTPIHLTADRVVYGEKSVSLGEGTGVTSSPSSSSGYVSLDDINNPSTTWEVRLSRGSAPDFVIGDLSAGIAGRLADAIWDVLEKRDE